MIQLSQKEKNLLEDQKSHEQICIKKYTNYANQTDCQELKNLFNSLAAQEQKHYDTLNQISSGQVPNISGGQGSQPQQKQQFTNQSQSNIQGTGAGKNNVDMCTDMLMTEKYVSGGYNTAIFEFRDANVRNVLNHIQKEEQQHGEQIFNYMQSKGLYNVQ